ncbi:MAG: glycosyltransferase family 1 protein [Pseudomonadota bacterium]|nr:glycosyltransferase family 1 protein [Pseudomonadota bacterium]
MRIAVVTETWPPEVNGVALTVQQFVQQLQALGHQIELTRPMQTADPVAPVDSELQQNLVRGIRLPRYPDLRLGLPSANVFRRNWRKQRPDAVYVATEGPLGWSAVRVAREMGVRVVTGFHTRFDDYVAHYGARMLSPIVLAWLRRFHNRADLTLVPTKQLVDALGAQGFHKLGHLARAVDCERFHPKHRDAELRASWGLQPDTLAVLHIGRLAPEKNLDLVARSFERIRQSQPLAKLIWVGDGPSLPELRSRHPEHVFCGVRRGLELSQHFASGDLFLFPSLTDTFGNVTLEAMASGLPVVAFDYAAAREHIHDGVSGRTVTFADGEAFILAAEQLADDRAQRSEMGLLARKALTALDQRQVALRLLQALIPDPVEEAA